MRFLIVLLSIHSSVAFASVNNFNNLIAESSVQEKRLHRKLLQSIQNTQYAIAFNEKHDKLQAAEQARKLDMPVRLIQYTE